MGVEGKERLTKMTKNVKIYNRKSVLKEKKRGREGKTHQTEEKVRKGERKKRAKGGGESERKKRAREGEREERAREGGESQRGRKEPKR